MPWHAHLQLDYRYEQDRTLLRFAHDGPLRVLKSLYPEGHGICHNVLVHPPGGLVAGDTLQVAVQVQPGAHALVSTPGATRFYRSAGEPATQQVHIALQAGARFEWLPLETIAHPGCLARNHLSLDIAPGAELLGWEVTALGLPATGQAFDHGELHQRIHWPGHWLEESRVNGQDQRLLQSALGLNGHRCQATLYLACGTAMPPTRRETLLQAVRDAMAAHPAPEVNRTPGQALQSAATCPNPHVLAVRVLAPMAEPAMGLLQAVWRALRQTAWHMDAPPPRIWSV